MNITFYKRKIKSMGREIKELNSREDTQRIAYLDTAIRDCQYRIKKLRENKEKKKKS